MTATIYIVTEVEDNILRRIEAFTTYESAHKFMEKLYELDKDRCEKDGWDINRLTAGCYSSSAIIRDGEYWRLGILGHRIDFRISKV